MAKSLNKGDFQGVSSGTYSCGLIITMGWLILRERVLFKNWMVLLLFLVTLLQTFTVFGKGSSSLYQRIDTHIVCLRSVMADGSILRGTGFFISEDLLVTVAHQVQDAKKVTAYLKDGQSSLTRILAQHKAWDIALLRVPTTQKVGLSLGVKEPELGQEVFTIGCALGLGHSLSRGVVSNPQRLIEGKRLLQVDLTVNSGDSGGPLVGNDGLVLGVIMGSWKEGAGLNFAVPVAHLMDFLQKSGVASEFIRHRLQQLEVESNPEVRLEGYQQLAAQYADQAEVHLQLGLALKQFGAYEKARDAIVQALTINPDDALAYWNLGLVYATGLHNTKSARQAFLHYLQRQPDGEKAPIVRAWLAATQ